MARWVSFVLALLIAENTIAAPPLEESSQPEVSAEETSAREALPGEDSSGLEESNAALLKRHGEIWGLMGLSAGAQEELNDTVVSLNTGIYKNRNEQPEIFKQVMAPTRSDRPLTYQTFVYSHKRRFALLEISESVQEELLAALEFTWKALHDPSVPEEKRAVAEQIRALMKSIGGPPPCCDDSIFQRAGMTTREP